MATGAEDRRDVRALATGKSIYGLYNIDRALWVFLEPDGSVRAFETDTTPCSAQEEQDFATVIDWIDKMEQVIRAARGLGVRAAVLRCARKIPSAEGPMPPWDSQYWDSRSTFRTRLRLYRQIPLAGGGMPPDFMERFAQITGLPERFTIYLAEIYRNRNRNWQQYNWMRNRDWQQPGPPQEILSIMGAADDSFMVSDRDIQNSVAFENVIRLFNERAFENTAHEAQVMDDDPMDIDDNMLWWDWDDGLRYLTAAWPASGERWRRIVRLTLRLRRLFDRTPYGLCANGLCATT
jgi:hypothetical protein